MRSIISFSVSLSYAGEIFALDRSPIQGEAELFMNQNTLRCQIFLVFRSSGPRFVYRWFKLGTLALFSPCRAYVMCPQLPVPILRMC
jgi:hypothetical protein